MEKVDEIANKKCETRIVPKIINPPPVIDAVNSPEIFMQQVQMNMQMNMQMCYYMMMMSNNIMMSHFQY